MRNRYFLWSIFFFIFFGTGSSQPYVNLYLKKIGFSPVSLSFVLSSVYLSMAFFRTFVPSILKKTGLKKGIIIGSFSYCVFALFLFSFKNLGIFIAGGILWGFGASILWTSTMTMILKISGKERYGIENGYIRLFLHIGLLSGFFILGQMAEKYGFRNLFLLAFSLAFLGFLFSFPLFDVKTSISNFKFNISFSKKIIIFSIALFIGAFGYGLILNQLNLFISEKFSISFLNKTIIFFYLSAGLLSFIGGKIIDKIGEVIPPLFFFLLSGILLITFSRLQTLFLSVFSIISLGGLFQIVPVSATVRIGKVIEEKKRASTIASTFIWRDVGIGISILLLGFMRSKFTYEKSFVIIGIIFILTGVFFILSLRNPEERVKT